MIYAYNSSAGNKGAYPSRSIPANPWGTLAGQSSQISKLQAIGDSISKTKMDGSLGTVPEVVLWLLCVHTHAHTHTNTNP